MVENIHKYIKGSHYSKYIVESSQNAELISHMKDFLKYLDERNLINPKQLSNQE